MVFRRDQIVLINERLTKVLAHDIKAGPWPVAKGIAPSGEVEEFLCGWTEELNHQEMLYRMLGFSRSVQESFHPVVRGYNFAIKSAQELFRVVLCNLFTKTGDPYGTGVR